MNIGLRLEWRHLVALLVICLLFVPARIYALPVTLPFELDPYRLLLLALLMGWFLSLLSDPQASFRLSGLEGPLGLYVLAIVGSLVANPDGLSLYGTEVVKTLSILVSLLLTFYFAVSVLRCLEEVEMVLGVLVLGGAVVAVLAVIESRTGVSPFGNLDRYIPVLQRIQADSVLSRGAHFRAFGSAEHPIALGALLALLAPIGVALAIRRAGAIWWLAVAALVIGAVTTVSRTAVVMLVAGFALFTALRWSEARRFLPLGVAVIAAVHLLVPGTLGTLTSGLHPSTIAVEQRSSAGSRSSAGRIDDLAPSLEEFRQKPVLGYGYGTRIVQGEKANTRLLDDQWLGSLLDTGVVGVLALTWLFTRFIGRLARASVTAQTGDAVLLAALASSVFAFAVGMFLYDAFSFTQVALVLFLILAAGSALALAPGRIFDSLPEPIVAPERLRKATLRARIAAMAFRRRRHVSGQLDRVRLYSMRKDSPPED